MMLPGMCAILAGLLAPGPTIDSISVSPDSVTVRIVGEARDHSLAAFPPWSDGEGFQVWSGSVSDGSVVLPRSVDGHDLLYARLALISPGGHRLESIQWVTDLSALPAAREPGTPAPGMKGVTCPGSVADLLDLGIQQIDTNVMLGQVVDIGASPEVTWDVDGTPVGINMAFIRSFDEHIRSFSDAGLAVSVIVLNGIPTTRQPANPLLHPRSDPERAPNHLGAFNLTDEAGFRCYRAAMEFLADRYSGSDSTHGRVIGWIVGNENQTHWEWANIGETPGEEVVHDYGLALRVAWLAVRRVSEYARVYVSLDHCWGAGYSGNPLRSMPGRGFLELLNHTARAQGDYPWHVAFHPYPENLFEPRFWLDRSALRGFDTPKITFRNLEVLPAFLRQERFLYRGEPRRILLSEQGFHCPDGAEGEAIQAAAYAAAWWRVNHIEGIDGLILHRHIDHRAEGGLHLGIWSADPEGPDASRPLAKRRIWDVIRAADTPEWEAAFEFAKAIIGIEDWEELSPSTEPIPEHCPELGDSIRGDEVVCDLRGLVEGAERVHCGDWRASWESFPDGLIRPTIFQHPPLDGPGLAQATVRVALPEVAPGVRLELRTCAAVLQSVSDGVGMSLALDGVSAWSENVRFGETHPIALDVTRWAGTTLSLTFGADSLATNAGDWANWGQPVIVRVRGAEQ